jgi:NAD(P)-dependent dehydrogenase (short-subunit alcohol dehydrogenase family)
MSTIFEDLKGKHVLITGGTGGIGGGLTPAFAQQGSIVSV